MDLGNKLFVLDAETDGIYGDVLSIAAVIVEDFQEEEKHFYGAVKIQKEQINEQWVRDNVYDHLKNAETFYDSEELLLEAFWEFYTDFVERTRAQGRDFSVVVDVPFPVEAGIFSKCINVDTAGRQKYSPFPIYDIESMLVASDKYEKNADRSKISGLDLVQHDAMNDVRISIRVLEELIASDKNIYSYHTFYFPFVWDKDGKTNFDDYTRETERLGWEDISINSFEDIYNSSELGMTSDQKYQMLQYFTEAARASIFGWGKRFVKCYAYNQVEIHEKAIYHIKTGKYNYNLNINGIKLRVFNTGVAVFTIEAENRLYRSIDDVKRINQYGRRIFAPFFDESGYCYECADELGIYNAAYNENKVIKPSTIRPKTDDDFVPEFISKLLPHGNIGDIKPAIDDRMFVACCVADALYSNGITSYKTSEIMSRDLYELIYIDSPDNCSCPSDSMRQKLLDESIYERWSSCGTLYGVSHHSMICVHNGNAAHLNFSFVAIYTHMVAMVLAQRAAVIVFDRTSSNLAQDAKSDEIAKFQKKYIEFCNQHNNIEITCQEQGVELYEMLQKAMYIKENNEKLESEVELLYETASAVSDHNLNKWGFIFALVFGIVGFLDFLCSLIPLILEYIQ